MPIRNRNYEPPKMGRNPFGSGTISILAVLAMLVLLPFTQYLAGLNKPDREVRSFDVSPPPPQTPPPEPPPEENQEPEEPPPEMDSPPPQLSLSQLNASVNPGVGNALAGDVSMDGFGVEADETLNEMDLFEMSDLDERPSRVREGRMSWPPDLQRERVSGFVHVVGVIQEDGSVEYDHTVEASHEEYEEMIIRFMETSRYSVPKVNGEPVKARLVFEIPIEYN